MWQYALWGLAGAAVNRALIYLEASQRAKGWPWRRPHGPGGGVYAVSVILHCAIGALVTWAAADAGLIVNALLAVGAGAVAPVLVKKASGYTLAMLPSPPAHSDQGDDDAA